MKNHPALAAAGLTLHGHAQSLLTAQPETAPQRTAREITEGIQGSKRALLGDRHNVSTLFGTRPTCRPCSANWGLKSAERSCRFNNSPCWRITTAANDTAGLAELNAILVTKVKPPTVHPDGTVTIDPTLTPAP